MSGRGSSARGRVRLCVRVCTREEVCGDACVQEESGQGGGQMWRWLCWNGVMDGWMFWVENGDVDTERLQSHSLD